MFKTRLLSGIVLVIAAIFLIVTGNEVLLFSTLLISCIGMFELFRVFKFEKSLLSVVPYIALILFYINLRWSFIPDVMMLFMGFLIVLMFVYVLSAAHGSLFWYVLCRNNAFICLPDTYTQQRTLPCLLGIFMLLGL